MNFRHFVLTVVALTCNAFVHANPGQPGTLDAFWNTGGTLPGKAVTAIGTGGDVAVAAALQPDGKVVLAGNCATATSNTFCLLRYKTDGTLDPDFNGSGKVVTALPNVNNKLAAMALQADGKIVVAGSSCLADFAAHFCAIRYNANGTLDLTFSGIGIATTVITPQATLAEIATSVAVQPDGKIVLAGYCNVSAGINFCAVRFNANGTLDSTFNGVGSVTTVIATGSLANAIALQRDGKIVLAGFCSAGSFSAFCAVRYNDNGTLDTSFNGSGKVSTPIGVDSALTRAAALQADGKLVLVGDCATTQIFTMCAIRHTTSGALDTTFNSIGVLRLVGGLNDRAKAVAIQPDGKLVMAGVCTNPSTDELCARRLNSDGSHDATFNGGGSVNMAPGAFAGEAANAVLLQPDGKIVIAGACANGSTLDFCALRFEGGPFGYQNCKPDIDGDGFVTATTDVLILARVALGMTGSTVLTGVNLPAAASRNTWPLIRDYLVTQCGFSLP